MTGWGQRVLASAGASALVMMSPLVAGTAAAITAPAVDPGAVPPDTPPAPDEALRMEHACMITGLLPGTDLGAPNPSQAFMDLPSLWKSAGRGAGVTVGVIDTGVNPSPRLPHVHGGGDYIVPEANGLSDCDSHGTVVAAIIGGSPAETDGLSGVAPDADIISVRQSSEAFVPANPSPGDFQSDRRAGTVSSLAKAVVHIANMGVRVINMSIVACIPVLKPVDQTTLGAALRYAAVDKDVVIVAAAGNLANQDCAQNPDIDATNIKDPRNWNGVVTVSTPSWFSDYVLSVSAVDGNGKPAVDDHGREISLSGPWVGAAAPGVFVQGFNDKGGVINATFDPTAATLRAINGTSFSAAYVSGLAALVRAKYPNLTAAQVIRRIELTAHSPAALVDNRVGYGTIDPAAALNNDVPLGPTQGHENLSRPLHPPPPPPPPDRAPMIVAVAGSAIAVAVIGVVFFVSNLVRERRS
ncbi:peptidase S8 [Mycobacterium riyadhense]|uniref:Peptidase S8 n=2 Tax=Mycobacterium riyadhense TaxID=486698 RepID=A0A1X2B9J0_9MYCO|nr:type VII secretion-associated serine protease mycosin [Mycobacterium riyadhense]ORW60231.1 peptidase S8 [Mycobacterium riyadhense]